MVLNFWRERVGGWSVSPVTKTNRDRAWGQLGTSGSGNHFVEFGVFTVKNADVGLPEGEYLALLSHSGSRGTGAAVCDHYSKLAISRHSDLPSELKRLSWLPLDSAEGQEYWNAMELMGKYAAANHALIHRHIARHLRAERQTIARRAGSLFPQAGRERRLAGEAEATINRFHTLPTHPRLEEEVARGSE